jgi:predicted amidophosphoribosyltransferase
MCQPPSERTQQLQYSEISIDKAELFCSYCDSKLDKDDKTCYRCGAPTKNSYYKEINKNCVYEEWIETDKHGQAYLSRIPKSGIYYIL